MQSHIRKVYACLAVTCHLHFLQNDRDLLRATAVTRGWNGYRNKSHHRKLTPEKKILTPLHGINYNNDVFLLFSWSVEKKTNRKKIIYIYIKRGGGGGGKRESCEQANKRKRERKKRKKKWGGGGWGWRRR